MQLFGGKLYIDGEVPRHNFNNIMWSAVTVFQILTGEDWNSIMYDCISVTSPYSAFYFVALIVVGDFMILNLFIAILLSNFGSDDSDDEEITDHVAGKLGGARKKGFLHQVGLVAYQSLCISPHMYKRHHQHVIAHALHCFMHSWLEAVTYDCGTRGKVSHITPLMLLVLPNIMHFR